LGGVVPGACRTRGAAEAPDAAEHVALGGVVGRRGLEYRRSSASGRAAKSSAEPCLVASVPGRRRSAVPNGLAGAPCAKRGAPRSRSRPLSLSQRRCGPRNQAPSASPRLPPSAGPSDRYDDLDEENVPGLIGLRWIGCEARIRTVRSVAPTDHDPTRRVGFRGHHGTRTVTRGSSGCEPDEGRHSATTALLRHVGIAGVPNHGGRAGLIAVIERWAVRVRFARRGGSGVRSCSGCVEH
jgi:hypothetical protein